MLEGIFSVLAAGQPGVIVGPIARFFGVIYNAVFNVIYSIAPDESLGIAIIVFTILVKTVLMPLIYKQQKSTFAMQKIQPEMQKIQKKYACKKEYTGLKSLCIFISIELDPNYFTAGGQKP